MKQAVRQADTETDRRTDRQADGAGPTSSISWLQEGMAGKMQQNLRGREKCSELPKSKRKIQRHEKRKVANQKETLKYCHDTSRGQAWSSTRVTWAGFRFGTVGSGHDTQLGWLFFMIMCVRIFLFYSDYLEYFYWNNAAVYVKLDKSVSVWHESRILTFWQTTRQFV